ncbi:MAG: succinyl-diaminopimelate desuccinylase [Hyphomicrobiales bacterium]|nr:succinyl-diaminopimelate desuccinylase [Hyphomicrobiales bacterium]
MPSQRNNGKLVLELAASLIRIPSLTPIHTELQPAAAESLDCLERFMVADGARSTRLTFEGGHARWNYPVDNLYVEWDAATPGSQHLCFMGHTDVVSPGDSKTWTADPFGGSVRNGFILGRGATDMKGAVAAFAVAAGSYAERCRARGAPCHVSMIITTDEEWAAVNGTRRVLEWMRDNGKSPSAFVVGEPSSQEIFGSAIKIGRRGSLCGTLNAQGVQGHAAYQALFENPNRALSLGLAILNAHAWTDAEPGMPATNFETIATQSGDFGATAIVPGEASALWNIRFTHHQTPDGLAAMLQRLLDAPPDWARRHPDISLLKRLELTANIDTASLPYYSPPNRLSRLAKSVLVTHCKREPELDARGGTTDGRFVHDYFPEAEIIELGLPENGGLTLSTHPEAFGRRGGMHQVDESCAIPDLQALTLCYRDLLLAYLGQVE